jgi:predicted anti-sigma-YlaC factor YlaD
VSKQPKPGIRRWIKGQMMKRIHGMITCVEFEEFIALYIEGELSQRQLSTFNLHLKMCRECREYLTAYRRTKEIIQASATYSEALDPSAVPEDLVKAILAAKEA